MLEIIRKMWSDITMIIKDTVYIFQITKSIGYHVLLNDDLINLSSVLYEFKQLYKSFFIETNELWMRYVIIYLTQFSTTTLQKPIQSHAISQVKYKYMNSWALIFVNINYL